MAHGDPLCWHSHPPPSGQDPRVGTLTGQQVGRCLPRAPSSRNGGRDHSAMPGEIISGGWAPSSRSAGRHHPGTEGAIIPQCRATSPGICSLGNEKGEEKYRKHRARLLYTPFESVRTRRVWGAQSPIELFHFQELVRRGVSPLLHVLIYDDGAVHHPSITSGASSVMRPDSSRSPICISPR
jgi:hypothetical protein